MPDGVASWRRWKVRQAWLPWLFLGPVLIWDRSGRWLALALTIHLVIQLWNSRRSWPETRGYRWANRVTLLRYGLLMVIGGCSGTWPPQFLAGGFWVAAALDAVDGWIARRSGGGTLIGAILDEETDAVFMLMYGIVALNTWPGNWWCLIAGWIRPLIVLAYDIFPPSPQSGKHLRWARPLAGIAFVLLPLTFLLPSAQGNVLVWLITSALMLSFLLELRNTYGNPTPVRPFP